MRIGDRAYTLYILLSTFGSQTDLMKFLVCLIQACNSLFCIIFSSQALGKMFTLYAITFTHSPRHAGYRVATVREKLWKMKNVPGPGQVREFHFQSEKFRKK